MDAAEWNPLANRFYRKQRIYTMRWNVDLTRCTVVTAPFGGPIGIKNLKMKIRIKKLK